MDLRLFSSLLAAKTSKFVLRKLGSGATAAPGLLSQYIDRSALRKLARYYPNIILISGTNGKTTTSRLISSILTQAEIPHIDNREGSNLYRGLVASLSSRANLLGKTDYRTAVLEVDEATLPSVIAQLSPKAVVLTNLFRDQLDRYGEVDTIRKIWQKALSNLDKSTTLVLNADDPAIAGLADTKAKVVFYGITDRNLNQGKMPHAADFLNCTRCGEPLTYERTYLSHLGHYHCLNCGLTKPRVNVAAASIQLNYLKGSEITLVEGKTKQAINLPLAGLYNVYNLLAAVALARSLNIDQKVITKAVEASKPAFGRAEQLQTEGKRVYISLVKNPTGFNEVIRTIFSENDKKLVLIAINDLIADGRDISWLWDVDFELLAGKVQKLFVSGIRAADIELRLKYAQVENVERIDELETASNKLIELAGSGETVFILPTYTAMLKLKSIFVRKGLSSQFWED